MIDDPTEVLVRLGDVLRVARSAINVTVAAGQVPFMGAREVDVLARAIAQNIAGIDRNEHDKNSGLVRLTRDQAHDISSALDSWTYWEAPDGLKNSGYPLDPRLDNHEWEPEDEEEEQHVARLDSADTIEKLLKPILDLKSET